MPVFASGPRRMRSTLFYDAVKDRIVIRNYTDQDVGAPHESEVDLGTPDQLRNEGRQDILDSCPNYTPALAARGIISAHDLTPERLEEVLAGMDKISEVAELFRLDSRPEMSKVYIRRLDELHKIPVKDDDIE